MKVGEFSEAFKAGVEFAKAETGDYEKHIVWPDADEIKAAADKAFYAHRGIRELTREEMLEHLRGLGLVNPHITEDTPGRVVITYDYGADEGRVYSFCRRVKIAGVDITQVKMAKEDECQCVTFDVITLDGVPQVDISRCPLHSSERTATELFAANERRLQEHDEAIGRLAALCEGPRGMWERVDALETERGLDHERINRLVSRLQEAESGHSLGMKAHERLDGLCNSMNALADSRAGVSVVDALVGRVETLSKVFDGLAKVQDAQEERIARLANIRIFGGAGGGSAKAHEGSADIVITSRKGSPLDSWQAAKELKKAAEGVDPDEKMEHPVDGDDVPSERLKASAVYEQLLGRVDACKERTLILEQIAEEANALMANGGKHWEALSRAVLNLQDYDRDNRDNS